jgi:hypothetical protein
MFDPIPFGLANPPVFKVVDAAPTVGGRDQGVFDQDGDVPNVVCRSAKE